MHSVNRQCVFTCLGIGLVSLGIILAVFWMDIFRSILATVSVYFKSMLKQKAENKIQILSTQI